MMITLNVWLRRMSRGFMHVNKVSMRKHPRSRHDKLGNRPHTGFQLKCFNFVTLGLLQKTLNMHQFQEEI